MKHSGTRSALALICIFAVMTAHHAARIPLPADTQLHEQQQQEQVAMAVDAAVRPHGRRLHQFFNQVGLGSQVGFPFFLDIVLNIFDGTGYAGIVRPISTAVDRSLAQTQLCTTSATARANLATCNGVPGFNALAVAGRKLLTWMGAASSGDDRKYSL